MAENERLGSAALAGAIGLASALLGALGSGTASPDGVAAHLLASLVVYFWAEDVYGSRGAAAATLLFAFNPLLAVAHGGPMMVCILLIAAAVYRGQRLLLDPSLQEAALVGVLGGVASLFTPVAFALLLYLLVLAAARAATRSAAEPGGRVRRANISVLLICGAVMVVVWRLGGGLAAAAPPRVLAAPLPAGWPLFALSAAPFVLLGARPWRRHRRYADASAVAAVVCFAAVAWTVESSSVAAARAALPAAIVLAAAVWDYAGAAIWRGIAWAIVAVQIVVQIGRALESLA